MQDCPRRPGASTAGGRLPPGSQRVAAPVQASNVAYKPGQPFQQPMGNPAKPTSIVALEPAQAMQMSSKLMRVFLGLGWENNSPTARVDVDASAIAFSRGTVLEAVCFHNLRNDAMTLKHTGDVLSGGGATAGGQDLERVYVWLEKLNPDVDMVMLVANIYSPGVDFSALRSAYVRVANADTNQELGRMWLAGKGWHNMVQKVNAVVFAKVFRCNGHWQIMMLGQPLVIGGCTDWQSMVPEIHRLGLATPPYSEPNPQLALQKQTPQASHPEEQKAQGQTPTRAWETPALAVSTLGGIAWAISIFTAPNPMLNHYAAANFIEGVDWGTLEVSSFANAADLGSLEDLGEWSGDAWGAAMDAIPSATEWSMSAATNAWGAVNDSNVFAETASFAGEAGGAAAEFGGSAIASIGDVEYGAALEAGGSAGERALEGVGGAIGDVGGAAQDAGGAIGDAAGGVTEAAGSVDLSGAAEALGNVAEGLGNAAQAVGPVLVGVGGAIVSVIGGLAGD